MVRKLFIALIALVVGFGTVGCNGIKTAESVKTAEDVLCEMVEPVVEAVAKLLRTRATVTAELVVAATGIALSTACTLLLDHIGITPDNEQDVVLANGRGTEHTKVSGATFISVTDKWCNTTGGCTGYDRCPTDWTCLFTGAGGTGKMSLFTTGSPDLSQQHIDGAAVSVFNRAGKTATLYSAHGYHGDTHTVEKSAKGDLSGEWQGRARSIIVGTPATSSIVGTPTTTPHSTTPTHPTTTTKSKPPLSGTPTAPAASTR
ncbi:peptidase inhibitor family I36 protein [Nocardia sp. NPDC004582]